MTSTATLKTSATAARGAVKELVTEARLDALNRSLAEHGIDAGQIIAIHEIPAQRIANALPARYRVLYRAR